MNLQDVAKKTHIAILSLTLTACGGYDPVQFNASISLPPEHDAGPSPEHDGTPAAAEDASARVHVPLGSGGALGTGGSAPEADGAPVGAGGVLGTGGASEDAGLSSAPALAEGTPGDTEILHSERLQGADGYKATIWYDCVLNGISQSGGYLSLGGYLYACTPEYSCRSPYGYEKCTDCRVYPQRWCLGTAELSSLYK